VAALARLPSEVLELAAEVVVVQQEPAQRVLAQAWPVVEQVQQRAAPFRQRQASPRRRQ
jgi:hypothetical protein